MNNEAKSIETLYLTLKNEQRELYDEKLKIETRIHNTEKHLDMVQDLYEEFCKTK